jgi:hypothetical protein
VPSGGLLPSMCGCAGMALVSWVRLLRRTTPGQRPEGDGRCARCARGSCAGEPQASEPAVQHDLLARRRREAPRAFLRVARPGRSPPWSRSSDQLAAGAGRCPVQRLDHGAPAPQRPEQVRRVQRVPVEVQAQVAAQLRHVRVVVLGLFAERTRDRGPGGICRRWGRSCTAARACRRCCRPRTPDRTACRAGTSAHGWARRPSRTSRGSRSGPPVPRALTPICLRASPRAW